MKIIVNSYPFPIEPLLKLKDDFPECNFIFSKNKETFLKEIRDSEIVITFGLRSEELEIAEKAKLIQSMRAGVDALPLEDIKNRNIILTTGRGIHKIHMTEYAIAMMINDARNIDQFIINKQNKLWKKDYIQDEIHNKKLGILGLGSIGKEIAKKASLMGMEVIGVKRSIEEIPHVAKVYPIEQMDIIFKECDYIINLLPHTKDTEKIINMDLMKLMKLTSCMINIGRGKTVDEDDLYEALSNNIFRKYVSDVFEVEPLPQDSPLWVLDNIIITPHICGPNVHYVDKAYEIVKQNIGAYLKDKSKIINIYSHKFGY